MKILILCLMLVSCATPYQKHGIRGGYWEKKLGENLFEVGFNGNGYTGRLRVSNYLTRRCAEVTLENGFTHFILVREKSDATVYYEAQHNSVVQKPDSTALIKLINSPGPDVIAHDAKLILGR